MFMDMYMFISARKLLPGKWNLEEILKLKKVANILKYAFKMASRTGKTW